MLQSERSHHWEDLKKKSVSSSITQGFVNTLDDIRLLEAVLFIYFFHDHVWWRRVQACKDMGNVLTMHVLDVSAVLCCPLQA